MKDLAILILAAGASRRFGGCKLLARVAGRPILESQIDLAVKITPGSVYLVSGAWHEEIKSLIKSQPLAGVIYNADWQQGMSTSLQVGIAHLAQDYAAVMVLLADQVALTETGLKQLRAAYDGENIACSLYQGRRGVPAIFGQKLYSELMRLSGDQGAKKLLYDTANPLVECAMPEASIDIDTPAELFSWSQNQPD